MILLLTGSGKSDTTHPYHNKLIRNILSDIADVDITEDLSILHPRYLDKYDVILNNSYYKEPTDKQFAAFFDFIENGKAYYGLHTASVSFLNSAKYRDMMGCMFARHDPVKTFAVRLHQPGCSSAAGKSRAPVPEPHPITKGMDDFQILDELYIVEGDSSKLEIVAVAENHPLMWCRNWGRGKMIYLALGHDDYSMNNSGYVKLLRNGVLWLTGRL
jgi:type 1 glutamine amidotransferase